VSGLRWKIALLATARTTAACEDVFRAAPEDAKDQLMIHGSCLCGVVRYEVRGTPLVMYHCD
jgi:hypothetical protein